MQVSGMVLYGYDDGDLHHDDAENVHSGNYQDRMVVRVARVRDGGERSTTSSARSHLVSRGFKAKWGLRQIGPNFPLFWGWTGQLGPGRRSHGLSAKRARRTKSSRPDGPQT